MKSYLEEEDMRKLEAATTCMRDRLLIKLLARLGCRVSEGLALTVEDIDFEHATIRILHLKERTRLSCPHCSAHLARRHTFCPKCGKEVEQALAEARNQHRLRTLHLDRDTLELLRVYIDRGGPVLRDGKLLLFGIGRHRAWQVVRECAKRAGLPLLINNESGKAHGVGPHSLRSSFATIAVQRDDSTDSIRMLQEWLGHANIGTTMRYRKVAGKELKDWYSRLWENRNSG